MEWKNVTKTQNEEAWLSDYIARVIAEPPPPLPPHDHKIGHVETHWRQVGPGLVYVAANPDTGTPEDRSYATSLILAQLQGYGFKQAVVKLGFGGTSDGNVSQKVLQKAVRLIQTGAVKIDRNGPDVVMAHVQGDGTDNNGVPDMHTVEIHKIPSQNAPMGNRGSIANMYCDCDWGKFMNMNRTRRWKDFQYTPCSHVIATFWSSQSMPTDESRAPGDTGGPGQMSLPGMPQGGEPTDMAVPPRHRTPDMGWGGGMPPAGSQGFPGPSPFEQLNLFGPGMGPGGATGPGGMGPAGGAPTPESVLPQFPMDPSLMPQVNPASTPGGRPGPTPTNPLQYPGGTFSSVRTAVDQQYQNGDLVRLNQETMEGTYQGRPESGMAGQPTPIAAGSVGEVLGTDPVTKMINVLFMGKQFNQMTYFEPFGATVWCWPSEVSPATQSKPPGPAVRRLY